jgi:AAA domain
MDISVSKDITKGFKIVRIKDFADLENTITKTNWSSGIFKDGYRNRKNFLYADCIALDVDNTQGDEVTIEKATSLFKDYRAIIIPTQNHRKPKDSHPVSVDRYRIILPLSERITDADLYYGTFDSLKEQFPFVDTACGDPSRYWKPSSGKAIVLEGAPLNPSPKKTKATPVANNNTPFKGTLLPATYNFIVFGANSGAWNRSLYLAAIDLSSQGYNVEEATNILTTATRNYEGSLNEADLKTIESAYNATPEHTKRGAVSSFNFQKVGDIINTEDKINWLVGDLLTQGGLSIIAGAPKSGKSTIIRQLAKCVAQGAEFLSRPCQSGAVVYLALEEQKALLSSQLKQLGVTNEDPFFIHCGPVQSPDKKEDLRKFVIKEKPALVVIDTLLLFTDGQDVNNYNDMYSILTYFREIARDSGAHILLVHHTNKSQAGGAASILGSNAIHGSVDCAIIFCNVNGTRKITTSQRGGLPFDNTPLEFNADKQTYVLGHEEGF